MIRTWLEFMLKRPEPIVPQTMMVHDSSGFVQRCIMFSLYFSVLCIGLPRLIKARFPKFYASLDEDKRFELPAFAAGFMHHIVIVPIGLWEIWTDFNRITTDIDYATALWPSVALVPFTFGYIMGDTIFLAVGELLKGKYAYAVHHAATFGLYYILLEAKGPIIRFISHLLVCEASNIVFEVAWFLRAAGYRDAPIMQVVEATFAVVFFVTRIVNLPLCVYAVLNLPGTKDLPAFFPYVLIPIVLLQFYWFGKILIVLAGKIKKRQQAPNQSEQPRRRMSSRIKREKVT